MSVDDFFANVAVNEYAPNTVVPELVETENAERPFKTIPLNPVASGSYTVTVLSDTLNTRGHVSAAYINCEVAKEHNTAMRRYFIMIKITHDNWTSSL